MITPVWIVGFTGHRPKDSPGRTSAEMDGVAPLIRKELAALQAKAKDRHGRAELLCGVGAGADLIAAREAEALGMAVHVILPMPESLYEQDFADPAFHEDWREARRFIRAAQEGVRGATFRVAHGSHLRDDCYYDLGAQIVYASDAIIALWDGEVAPPMGSLERSGTISPGRGGTADIIKLAEADSMPYLKGKKVKEGYAWLPTPVRRINTLTGEVGGDASHFAHERDAGWAEIQELQHAAHTEHGQGEPLENAEALMSFVDEGATDWAKKLRRNMLRGLALHFIASLIAAIAASAQMVPSFKGLFPPGLAAVELLLVVAAIWFTVWCHLKHAQARWLELRLATELTRGLIDAGPLLDPLFPIATDHLPGWRRFCLSVGLTLHCSRSPILTLSDPEEEESARTARFLAEKENYLSKRIGIQMNHFEAFQPQVRHFWHLYAEWASPVISGLALVFIAVALWHKVDVWLDQKHAVATVFGSLIFYFLPIALPLLAGAITSLQIVTDVKRRSQVYPEMVERLRSARDFLPAVRTPAALRRFVRRTEEILLDEIVGWYAAAKGISH